MYLGPIGKFEVLAAILWPMGGGLESGTREIIAACIERSEMISLAIAAFPLVLPNLDFIFRTTDRLPLARSDIPLLEAHILASAAFCCA